MGRGKNWMVWQQGELTIQYRLCKLIRSALQSLNLPGSIQALERPAGLPPSLLKKAEEVESEGGVQRIQSLLTEVQRLSKSNSKLLSDVCPTFFRCRRPLPLKTDE
jgi:hypothetical protein